MASDESSSGSAAALLAARKIAHDAVQWPSRAARANLPAAADDGHSSLGWNETQGALLSQGLGEAGRFRMGFAFDGGDLLWLDGGEVAVRVPLAGLDPDRARDWCDARLTEAGLRSTDDAVMPYALDPVSYAPLAEPELQQGLRDLGRWFSRTQGALDSLVQRFGALAVREPAVRCWPHHFDLAVLFALEAGDPETARSAGLGLSPGDDSFQEPYFYANPWPVPTALPEAPGPFSWHTEGFTSLLCPVSRLAAADDLDALLVGAFNVVRGTLYPELRD